MFFTKNWNASILTADDDNGGAGGLVGAGLTHLPTYIFYYFIVKKNVGEILGKLWLDGSNDFQRKCLAAFEIFS